MPPEEPPFTIRDKIDGSRGEWVLYTDAHVYELVLTQTSGRGGHRLYCSDTAVWNRQPLSLDKRRNIILNLCEFFKTKDKSIIFVLDVRDKDRHELQTLFADLSFKGHKVTVESDSAEKRDEFQDQMHLKILKAHGKLTIDDVVLHSVEDYWRWKRQNN